MYIIIVLATGFFVFVPSNAESRPRMTLVFVLVIYKQIAPQTRLDPIGRVSNIVVSVNITLPDDCNIILVRYCT